MNATEAAALLKAPYLSVRLAPMTSINNPHPTLSIRVSLDEPANWSYGIIENSRYALFFVRQASDGRAQAEMLSHGLGGKGGFRKTTVATPEKALAKIQEWIDARQVSF